MVQERDETIGDPVRQYLKEIGRFPLLTGEDERRLGRLVQAGHAARRRLSSDVDTTPGERGYLRRAVQAGDEAKNEFLAANLRLVVSIAKRYRWSGLPLSDRIQEGNLGLIKAIDRFDASKGFKFSTLASWYIRQAILSSIENSRTIRVPRQVATDAFVWRQMRDELHMERGRVPTDSELATRLEWDLQRVRLASLVPLHTTSLDRPLSEEGDEELGAILADLTAWDPAEVAAGAPMVETVARILRLLSEQERRVLGMHFGLDGSEPLSLNDIGERLGITRERVRKLESRALFRLRHAIDSEAVAELLAS